MTDSAEAADAVSGVAVRTFLFADLRGYTRFIVEHGDAAGVPLVDGFASAARRVIETRRGVLLGQAGDEVIGVFLSARDALHAALNLQAETVSASMPAAPIHLPVGIGIDTGEAIPSGDSFVGAALNLAARLCKLAGPQEILASEAVVHVARKVDGIGYVERGLAELKGFSAPVHVFRVVAEPGLTPATPPRSQPEAVSVESVLPIGGFLGALPSTPLVARDQEMARALGAADAVTSGVGRLLMLTGEAGVGKTRLAQEIMLTVRNRRFAVAAGRCYQLQNAVPFYPFRDALASLVAQSPADIRATMSTRWPYLTGLVPGFEGVSTKPSERSADDEIRLFREVTAFAEALATTTPVAILLDDLHWADGASLQLLEHLARHTRADRILLVGTYRDAEIGRHHPLEAVLRDLSREDLLERVPIRRLEAAGTAELVATSLGDPNAPPELGTFIHNRADGNPFFTQQLLRFFVERGDIYQAEGRWVDRSLNRIEVPESVRSVIGQRMDRLAPTTQEVLRDAAVLGQTFAFDSLVSLTGRSEDEVEAAVEEARAAGLVAERSREEYAFDHALTQQTLYGEIPSRRKRRLHGAAAETLERLPGPEREARSAELALHFVEAGQPERAIPFALIAGDRARSVFANREAEQQYATALEIAERTQNLEGEAGARARRGRLALEMFRGKPALKDYERLLEIARAQGDRHRELDARLGVAAASYTIALDETDRDLAGQCRAMYESAIVLAEELGDKRAKVEALLGTRWLGDFWPDYEKQVEQNLREALEVSRHLGDEDLLLRAELASWSEGTRAEAEANAARLVTRLTERRELFRLNTLYFSLMWANLRWGEFERAVEVSDAGIRLAREIGAPPVQYETLKSMALGPLGRYSEAKAALEREVTDAEHPFGQAMRALGYGLLYTEVEALDRAVQAFDDLLERARKLRRAWMMARAAIGITRARLRTGPPDPAALGALEDQLREVRTELPATLRAEFLLGQGSLTEAVAEAHRSAVEAEADELLWNAVIAQEVEARALLAAKRFPEAAAVAGSALKIAEEHHALSMVWRLAASCARGLRGSHDEVGAKAMADVARVAVQRVADSINDRDIRETFLASPPVRSALELVL